MSILSVQSHVAYGHVGNRSAVFPLENLGFEVWPINTVQFSNHPGYGVWQGDIFPGDHVDRVWAGVCALGVATECDAVLSGYLGDVSTGVSILRALGDIRVANPAALYCCDPVIGDFGKGVYVHKDIPCFIRDRALPLADVITPNQFEAGLLTGIRISTTEDARKACRAIHDMGPRIVLVTSFKPEDEPLGGSISMLLSENGDCHRITTPELPMDQPPNGAGDLCSALFLGHFLRAGSAVAALELMTDSVFSVFEKTREDRSRELRIIQCREALASGRRRFVAVRL